MWSSELTGPQASVGGSDLGGHTRKYRAGYEVSAYHAYPGFTPVHEKMPKMCALSIIWGGQAEVLKTRQLGTTR
jgi:hypothetical protein